MTAHNLAMTQSEPQYKVAVLCENEIQRRSQRAFPACHGSLFQYFSSKERTMIEEIIQSAAEAVFVMNSITNDVDFGIQEVQKLRRSGYTGYIALIAEDPSVEHVVRVLKSGADDYLVSGTHLCLISEMERIQSRKREMISIDWNPEAIGNSGFFRSLGLPPCQIELLVEYARDFPKVKELAARLGQSQVQTRKKFSKIYESLREPLAVETQSQLTQLLTIFAMLG